MRKFFWLLQALVTRGLWKTPSRRSGKCASSNYDRVLLALCDLIGAVVTLSTFGRVSFWGGLDLALKIQGKQDDEKRT